MTSGAGDVALVQCIELVKEGGIYYRGGIRSLADPRYSLVGLCFPQNPLLRDEL